MAAPVPQGTNRHYCRRIAPRIVVGSPESSISLLHSGPEQRQKCPMSPSLADRLRNLRDSQEIGKTYSLYGQARLPNYLQHTAHSFGGQDHDAKTKPNVNLFTSSTNETEAPGIGSTWRSGMTDHPKGGKRGQERSSLCSYHPQATWPSGLLLEGSEVFYELNCNNRHASFSKPLPLNNHHHLRQAGFLASIWPIETSCNSIAPGPFQRSQK